MPAPDKEYVPTAAEQAVIDYHRRHLQGRTFLRNPDGSLTTFRGAIVGLPEGETLIPTYWHGTVRDVPEAVRFAMKSGLKFPAYKTPQQAEAAERRLHEIMEADTRKYLESVARAAK